jgi:biopolymer transport protein ExbD
MPKHKIKRHTPSLDMTPMVDLAFLLVTFFMLTTKFRPEEPVSVDMPSATTEIPLPGINVVMLTVSKDGRVFFDMDQKDKRARVLDKMSEKYKVGFTANERTMFSNLTSFGMPVKDLRTWLNLKPSERPRFEQKGIPYDSANNELKDWVLNARLVNPNIRLAIKGDRDADFTAVRRIMETVQEDAKVKRFNLLTNLEAGAAPAPKK